MSHLLAAGIARTGIQAVALDSQAVSDLPPATAEQRQDRTRHLERVYWRANVVVFFVALAGLLAALYAGKPILAILALGIIVRTFVRGERFAVRVPHAHLDQQSVPLHHPGVGSHHLDSQKAAAAQIVEVAQVALPATQCQTADSRIRHHAAADREDATEKHVVTPGPILPARDVVATVLLR